MKKLVVLTVLSASAIAAATLMVASPASAAEYKINCTGATVVYEPTKLSGGEIMFHTKPHVVAVMCNDNQGTSHVLGGMGKLGYYVPNAAFATEEDVSKFLGAVGDMVAAQASKRTVKK